MLCGGNFCHVMCGLVMIGVVRWGLGCDKSGEVVRLTLKCSVYLLLFLLILTILTLVR